jgi:hypothetical protein
MPPFDPCDHQNDPPCADCARRGLEYRLESERRQGIRQTFEEAFPHVYGKRDGGLPSMVLDETREKARLSARDMSTWRNETGRAAAIKSLYDQLAGAAEPGDADAMVTLLRLMVGAALPRRRRAG